MNDFAASSSRACSSVMLRASAAISFSVISSTPAARSWFFASASFAISIEWPAVGSFVSAESWPVLRVVRFSFDLLIVIRPA